MQRPGMAFQELRNISGPWSSAWISLKAGSHPTETIFKGRGNRCWIDKKRSLCLETDSFLCIQECYPFTAANLEYGRDERPKL